MDWRTLRVFIDSTFRDMHAERDHLVKVVFPDLRERLEKHRVHLVEIELRWGITEEQERNDQVLDLCLNQIDECRPFYIGILGEKYGWVPATLPEAQSRHGWTQAHTGKSITELSILYAVLLRHRTDARALFLFRDPAFISDVPESKRFDVQAENVESAAKLARLKQHIREAGLPIPVVENYPCRYAGLRINWDLVHSDLSEADQQILEQVAGDGLVDNDEYNQLNDRLREIVHQHSVVYVTGLEEFGRQVYERLWGAIRDELRLDEAPLDDTSDPLADERAYHERYMESRVRVYVGRRELVEELCRFADSDANQPFLVTGPSGSGKSAVLAKFVHSYANQHPDALVLGHFVGASPRSTSLRQTLERICSVLKQEFQFENEIPPDTNSLIRTFRKLLTQVPQDRRVVLVLDAINQLDESDNAHQLYWLPRQFPPHVKLITSCIDDPNRDETVLSAFVHRKKFQISVPPLTNEERFDIVQAVLSLSAKSLEPRQIQSLLKNPATTNPLYLIVALEELRGFGFFDQLNSRIDIFSRDCKTVTELFTQVIKRLEDEWATNVVHDVLTLLACSRRGLSDRELLAMVAGTSDAIESSASDLFSVLRQLRPYLYERGQLKKFSHRSLNDAVSQRYLGATASRQAAHARLAQYFESLVAVDPRRLDELPWQFVQSGNHFNAVELITDLATMETKYRQHTIGNFLEDCEMILRSIPPEMTVQQQFVTESMAFAVGSAQMLRDEELPSDEPELVSVLAFNSAESGPLVQKANAVLQGRHGTLPSVATRRPTYSPDNPRRLSHQIVAAAVVGLHLDELGELAYVVLADGRILRWQVKSGEMTDIVADNAPCRRSALTGPGDRLFVLTGQSTLKVWTTDTGELLQEVEFNDSILDLALSPDAKSSFVAVHRTGLCQCTLDDNGMLLAPTVLTPLQPTTHLSVSSTGRWVACGHLDGNVLLWDTVRSTIGRQFRAHDSAVTCCAFHPSDSFFVTGGDDWVLKTWECPSGTSKELLPGHSSKITTLVVSPDGNYAVSSGGWDQTILIWDIMSSQCVASHRSASFQVTELKFSADGRSLLSGGSDGWVELWDF